MTTVDFKDDMLRINGPLGFSDVMSVYNQSLPIFLKRQAFSIDLAGVKHTDSSALALICEWLRVAKREKIKVQFINTPAQLRSVAMLCGVATLFSL